MSVLHLCMLHPSGPKLSTSCSSAPLAPVGGKLSLPWSLSSSTSRRALWLPVAVLLFSMMQAVCPLGWGYQRQAGLRQGWCGLPAHCHLLIPGGCSPVCWCPPPLPQAVTLGRGVGDRQVVWCLWKLVLCFCVT